MKRAKKRGKFGKSFLFAILSIFLIVGVIAPTAYLIYNSSAEAVFFNKTEVSNLGVRPSTSVLFMDFNSAPETITYNPYGFTYVKDNSIYNNFGTKPDTHPWNPGVVNGSLGFDGSDYVTANRLSGTGNFTFSVWIKYNSLSGVYTTPFWNGVDSGTAGFGLGYRKPGSRVLYSGWGSSTGEVTGITSSDNVWYHLVAVYNGTHNTFYVNGTRQGSTAYSLSNFNSGNLNFGGLTSMYYLSGSMDEAMIFNRSLSQAEVTALYNNQSQGLRNSGLETSSNLVSYYKFEELSGTTASDNKGINTGTLNGYPTDTSPAWNSTGGYDRSGAYSFDGSNDYISVPDSGALSVSGNALTISAWVNPAMLHSNNGLVYKGSGSASQGSYSLGFYTGSSNNKLNFRLNGQISEGTGQLTSNAALAVGAWSHVVAVYNGSKMMIYINGTLDNSNAYSTPITNQVGNLLLGSYYNTGGLTFNGSMDNVQIFNRSLSAAEILCLYNGTGCGGVSNSNYMGKYSNGGDFKSLVFYNQTSTYWNVNLSIADTNSPATGIVGNKNEIDLTNANLVSYWGLDGNYLDGTRRNNGTCTGITCPNNASGISSGAMRFDGTNSRINVPGNWNISGNITLCAWVFDANPADTCEVIASKALADSNNCNFIIQKGCPGDNGVAGKFSFMTNVPGVWRTVAMSTANLPTNQWVHVCTTYDKQYGKVYFNGFLDSQTAQTNTLITSTDNLTIGHASWYAANSDWGWNGSIDELLIYNKSLSSSEISQLYKSGLSQHANTNVTIQTRTANSYNISDASLFGVWGLNGYNFSDSRGTNNGSPQNGVIINKTSCKIGNCAQFDGSNDYISLGSNGLNLGANNFTISLWFNPNDHNLNSAPYYYPELIATQGGWSNGAFGIRFDNYGLSQKVSVHWNPEGDPAISSTHTFSKYAWHSVIVTRTGNNLSLYVDNLYEGSKSVSNSLNLAYGGALYAGNGVTGDGTRAFYNGSLDEIMIFNRSLSLTEINSLYGNQSIGQRILANDSSLVSNWKLDEDEILGTESSSMNNQGTCFGTCPLLNSSGIVGNAYKFDGTNHIASTRNLGITGNHARTMSFWFNPTPGASYSGNEPSVVGMGSMGGSAEFAILYDAENAFGCGGGLYFGGYANDMCGSRNTIVQGQWNFVTTTYDGTTVKVYINGNTNPDISTAKSLNTVDNTLIIGGDIESNINYRHFKGMVDEVRVYNRTLSVAEISDLYSLGTTHLNWSNNGAYSNELILLDNAGSITSSSGKFMQYKTNFYTNDTNVVPYLISQNIAATALLYPAVTLISPANENASTNLTQVFSCSASSTSNLSNSTLFIYNSSSSALIYSNTTIVSGVTSRIFNWTYNFSNEGKYLWTCNAFNNQSLGAFASSNYSLYVESILPLVNFSSPTPEDGNITGINNVSFNLTMNKNASTCRLQFGSSTYYMSVANAGSLTRANYTLNGISSGSYSYYFICNDSIGASASTVTRSIVVDVTPANLTGATPINNTGVNRLLGVNFTANITDVGSGIRNTTLYVYNSTDLVYNSTNSSFVVGTLATTISIPVVLVDGIYNWFVSIFDWTGNFFQSTNRTVVIVTGTPINSCQAISSSGVYVLAVNITNYAGTCLTINSNNVVIDGNNFTIDGDDSGTDYGIYASGRTNVTIKNFRNITDFYSGIYLSSVTNSNINNLNSSSNTQYGVYLASSSNNNFSGAFLSNTNKDFYCTNSNNNLNLGTTFGIQQGCIYWLGNQLVPGDISSCGVFRYSGNYNLTQNVSITSDPCFLVLSDNVLLNLNEFNVTNSGTNSGDYAVSISNYNNLTINNGKIYSIKEAVYLSNSSNNNFGNLNLVSTAGNTTYIYLSDNNRFVNGTINSSASCVNEICSDAICPQQNYFENITMNCSGTNDIVIGRGSTTVGTCANDPGIISCSGLGSSVCGLFGCSYANHYNPWYNSYSNVCETSNGFSCSLLDEYSCANNYPYYYWCSANYESIGNIDCSSWDYDEWGCGYYGSGAGCSSNYGRYGTLDCTQVSDEPTCTNYGCTWDTDNSVCGGSTASSCQDLYNSYGLDNNYGCYSQFSSCSGPASQTCSDFYNYWGGNAPGCSRGYIGCSGGSPSGSPSYDCQYLWENYGYCDSYAGCSFDGNGLCTNGGASSFNSAVTCANVTSKTSCNTETNAQCIWNAQIAYSLNNTFYNVLYNANKESVASGSQLYRKWGASIYTKDQGSLNVNNVNVAINDSHGNNLFNLLTDVNGRTSYVALTEYLNNGTKYYSNNYTIQSSRIGFATNTTVKTISSLSLWEILVRDITAPHFTNIFYTPNLSDDVDPSANMNFSSIATDNWVNVSTVILQLYDGSTWTNHTMDLESDRYLANLNLSAAEKNYTFNIFANDTYGNANVSANYTFESAWDCTFNLLPKNLGSKNGFGGTSSIGTITIVNTGDTAYSGGCNLDIELSHNLASGRIRFDNSALPRRDYYGISPFENKTVNLSVLFNSDLSDENAAITATDLAGITSTRSVNSSLNILSSSGQPYLKVVNGVESLYDLNLTLSNLSIQSSLQNIPADGFENTTAYNVSYQYIVPANFLVDGQEDYTYENISNNSIIYTSINLIFDATNLGSLGPGAKELYIQAYGYDSNGSLIVHSNNQTLLSQKITFNLNCYNESDGIEVPACGSLDGDYVAQTTTIGGAGGGAGGGGGGGGALSEKSDASFELLSGKEQEFTLRIDNKLSNDKKNINVSVSGINPEYLSFAKSINLIRARDYIELKVKITAPAYFTQGKYVLKFNFAGDIIGNATTKYTETKTVTLYITELTRATADTMLNESTNFLMEMNESGMVLKDVEAYLAQMNTSYNDVNFLTVRENFNKLKQIYTAAFEAKKLIEEMNKSIIEAEYNGIDVLRTKKLFYTALVIYQRGDYLLALSKLQETRSSYLYEAKGEYNVLVQIKNNPLQSFGIFLMISGAGIVLTLATKYRIYKNRIKLLGEEEQLLLQLMKTVQRECFERNKMSMEEYEEAMIQYERKLAEAIEERVRTETRLANLFNLKGKSVALKQEKERLVSLMRVLQNDYLVKGKVETRIYDNMMKTYSSRLSKVEEELVFIEANEAIKGAKK